MSSSNLTPIQREKANALLDRLAASLGCSPEAFYGQNQHQLSETLELLNLWFALEEPQDRAKAMSFLRNAKTKARALDEVRAPTSGEPVALAHAMQKPEKAP
ncbi:hypothetical protein ACFZ8E_01385 [Methylobacterium sp. HMF5984]|uniref:hypothetical protein n=1 Tax=Methylobacterium sp. HMF5984 TaxID=3367370 RepID=UPI0038528C49